jgi:hypothetical protein
MKRLILIEADQAAAFEIVDPRMRYRLGHAEPDRACNERHGSAMDQRMSRERLPPWHARKRRGAAFCFGQEIALERIIAKRMAERASRTGCRPALTSALRL